LASREITCVRGNRNLSLLAGSQPGRVTTGVSVPASIEIRQLRSGKLNN
jgi:hypothetical protein